MNRKAKIQILVVVLAVILIFGGGYYFGNKADDPVSTDVSQFTENIEVLEMEILVLRSEKELLVSGVQNKDIMIQQLVSEVEEMSNKLALAETTPPPAVVTPTPTPIPTVAPVYVAPFIHVKVTADKIVTMSYKKTNAAGYPLMLPESEEIRQKFLHGERIKVKPEPIRGDGSHNYYELYDYPGKYVQANKVEVIQ